MVGHARQRHAADAGFPCYLDQGQAPVLARSLVRNLTAQVVSQHGFAFQSREGVVWFKMILILSIMNETLTTNLSSRGRVRLRSRPDGRSLQLDLFVDGQRLRKNTGLADTPANRSRLAPVLSRIGAARTLGLLDAEGQRVEQWLVEAGVPVQTRRCRLVPCGPPTTAGGYSLRDCSAGWLARSAPRWRVSTATTMRELVDAHLVPRLGVRDVRRISPDDLLDLRAALSAADGEGRRSPRTVNAAMRVLAAILADAARRFSFDSPAVGLKPLRTRKAEVLPFAPAEVQAILQAAPPEQRPYLAVRFFSGLRSAEINGLKWCHVDFDAGLILVRESFAKGRVDQVKSEASRRDVQMSSVLRSALRAQAALTHDRSEYVFRNRGGNPIEARNFARRTWYPLLRQLGLQPRRPYQTRHTCATLWLAAGENPEWIARQLGHADTKLLFETYSRYIPNLTRQDGSAFERLLERSGLAQSVQVDFTA